MTTLTPAATAVCDSTTTPSGSGGVGNSSSSSNNNNSNANQQQSKGHRRQESMYTMTGLYAETGDDNCSGSENVPPDDWQSETATPPQQQPNSTATVVESSTSHHSNILDIGTNINSRLSTDTVIKCHSRQASSGLVDRDKSLPNIRQEEDLSRDCGFLRCRPIVIQKFARIKVMPSFFFISPADVT